MSETGQTNRHWVPVPKGDRLDSDNPVRTGDRVVTEHGEESYQLRRIRTGKLIPTKQQPGSP